MCIDSDLFSEEESRLTCFHDSVRKSESWSENATHQETEERTTTRYPTAALLCRGLEGLEKDSQERITDFSVNTRAAEIRTLESF